MKTPTRMFLAAGFLAAAISQQARASLILWDGGTSAAWSNGANWIGGTAPANDTTTDQAGFVFSALPAFQPDAGTRQVNGIEIGDGSTAVPEFEISGTDLTLGSGGILKNAASANTTISTDLTLAAGQTWTNNSSGVLLATGGIDNGGFALTVGGSGGTRATGQISGSGSLTMEGSGTLLLEGNNTYTGGTFISTGTLQAGAGDRAQTLGADSSAVVFNGAGAVLQLAGNMTGSTREYVFNETGTIDTNGFDLDIEGAVSGDGGLEKAGNETLALNAVNSYAGGTVVRGGELVVGASGVVSHSESDFTVGDLSGEAGVLRIAGGSVENNWATLGNEAGATGTANMTGGSWTTNGSFFLGNLGAGSFDLSGGDVAVNFFTLYVGNNGTGLLSMSGGNLTTAQAVLGSEFGSSGNATVVGGRWINAGMLMVGDAGSGGLSISGNGVVEVGGTLSRGDGGSIALESGGTLQIGRGGATGALDTDLVNNGRLVFDRTTDSLYSGTLGGSGILTKNGSGTLTLSGSNTYNGTTTVNAGTLALGASERIADTSDIVVASGTFDLAGFNESLGSLAGSGNIALGSGTLTTNSSSESTFSGVISGAGGSLIKNGSGSLTLSGNNSYSGGTTLAAGQLNINSASAIGLGALTINGGSLDNTSGSSITLSNNNAQNWNADIAFIGTNDLNLGTGSITMNASRAVTVNSGNLTIGGVIAGSSLGLTKNGPGTLTLSGANTYNGTTTVNSGTLSLGASERIADTSDLVVASGTFDLAGFSESLGSLAGSGNITLGSGTLTTNSSSSSTFSGVISGIGGGLSKFGPGALTLSGNNSYSGGTTLAAGQLNINSASAIGTGELTINGGSLDNTSGSSITLSNNNAQNWNFDIAFIGTNDLNLGTGSVTMNASRAVTVNSGNLTIGGVIAGSSLGLTKNGSGILILSGANTYNGTTTINAGTLSLGASERIADTSDLVVASGTFDLGGFNESLGSLTGSGNLSLGSGILTTNSSSRSALSGVISGAGGSLIKNGSGSLSLLGTNSYSGPTAINSGTLAVNGSIANSVVTVANGGTLSGAGAVGNTIVASGGKISPGNSPGTLDTGDLTLEAGGGYDWEIAAVSGTAGTDWDLIQVGGGSGNATIAATPADKFTIFVIGNPTGWNPAVSYLWDIVDWGIAMGFDAGAFAVDTTGFTGAAPIGSWSLLDSGGFLKLGYFVGDPEWSGGSGNWSTGFVPPLTDGADITFTGPGGNSTNDIPSGTVSSVGAISFATGAGAYILAANSGSAGFDSSTPLGLGGNVTNNSTATQTIRLALDIPGARTFQAATGNIVLEGDSSGAGSIVKTGGGSLLVGGDLLLGGDIEIQQGLLSLNGRTTAGNLTVGAGAMLGGTGPIEADVFNNGTVSPGNSIGTMTVSGDYAQSSASSLDIEIAGPGSFDRLVVSGQASLAGTLNIVPLGGNQLAFGEQYAFLDAGSIAGAFDTINMPAGFRGRFMENGSAGTLLVAPASYTQAAVTANQFAAAQALDSFISATGGDRMAVSMELDALTAAEYPAAFEQTMPGIYENLAGFAFEQAFVQAQLLSQRFGSLRLGAGGFEAIGMRVQPIRNDIDGTPVGDFGLAAGEGMENWSAWVLGSGIFSNTTGSPDIPDSRNNAGGFLAGADHNWGGNFSTGLYAGYQYNDAEFDGGSSILGNSVLFGGYAAFSHGDYFADAIVGGGYTGYRARRSIDFGTIDRIARAEPGGGLFTAAVNFGRDWHAGGFVFSPIAGAQYTYAGVGAFTEDGADSLDLAVGRQDANSLRSTLGGRIAYPWNAGKNLTLVPEVRMFWQHEFLDGARTINSSLDGGAGAAFGFDTGNPSRDSVFAGAGVGMRIGRTWNAGAFYNVDFGNPDFSSNIVSLSLGTSF